MTLVIGPTFDAELRAAGVVGPMTWWGDGTYDISGLTPDKQAQFLRVLAAHDPNKRPIPDVTKRQMLTWLLQNGGKTEADVIAALNGIADPAVKAQALIDWNYPDRAFQRSNPMFDQLAPAFAMTPTQIDAAFIAAAEL